MTKRPRAISRRIGRFGLDRALIAALLLAALALAGWSWLQRHPQHNPLAPLDLRDPAGWATQRKLASLRQQPAQCDAVLERSAVSFERLEPQGEGVCRRADRIALSGYAFAPSRPVATCPVQAGLSLWMEQGVQPAAREILGSAVARIEHFGTFSCRRMYNDADAPWSEHATGNAMDIAAFVLDDGRRISLLGDWEGDDSEARFLRAIRDEACPIFGTVLSPDYNAAHRDHFHFDQAPRAWSICR